MKKTISILFTIFVLIQTTIFAQTAPSLAVMQIRHLIESAKTDFKDDQGALIQEDKDTKISYYETKKPTAGAQTFIYTSSNPDVTPMYVINYDVKAMDTNMLGLMTVIVNQYIDELNVMVKSGNYTGKDYKDANGMGVTDIKDKDGNYILRYQSNSEKQNIYIYGTKQ
jgi:hypothetical protein